MTRRYSNADPTHRPHGAAAILRWGVTDRLLGRRRRRPPGPGAPHIEPDLELIRAAEPIDQPIKWAAPNDMQKGRVAITTDDIIANLPYHENCALWFDHHYTNRIDQPFEGLFRIAPSAAGIVYEYYKERLPHDFCELIIATDKIDSADLNLDEILNPEKYPYILPSFLYLPGF